MRIKDFFQAKLNVAVSIWTWRVNLEKYRIKMIAHQNQVRAIPQTWFQSSRGLEGASIPPTLASSHSRGANGRSRSQAVWHTRRRRQCCVQQRWKIQETNNGAWLRQMCSIGACIFYTSCSILQASWENKLVCQGDTFYNMGIDRSVEEDPIRLNRPKVGTNYEIVTLEPQTWGRTNNLRPERVQWLTSLSWHLANG